MDAVGIGLAGDVRRDAVDQQITKPVCAQSTELCRQMGLLTTSSVAIDGSKFKAVNTRDKNITHNKVERRRAQLEESVARYLALLQSGAFPTPSRTTPNLH